MGFVAYLGPTAVEDLQLMKPAGAYGEDLVFGINGHGIGRRIRAAALVAQLRDGFSDHSARVGMAINLARQGTSIPEIM